MSSDFLNHLQLRHRGSTSKLTRGMPPSRGRRHRIRELDEPEFSGFHHDSTRGGRFRGFSYFESGAGAAGLTRDEWKSQKERVESKRRKKSKVSLNTLHVKRYDTMAITHPRERNGTERHTDTTCSM